MKKLLFYSFCVLAIFNSCKKNSSSTGSGSISAMVNGNTKTFNTDAVATLSNAGGIYSLLVKGIGYSSGDTSSISILVGKSNPITTGVYTPVGTAGVPVSVTYSPGYDREYSNDTARYSYQPEVTITSISNSNVQGTFSGNLILYSGKTLVMSQSIGSGSFNVNIQR
jgi:hypothetical protein